MHLLSRKAQADVTPAQSKNSQRDSVGKFTRHCRTRAIDNCRLFLLTLAIINISSDVYLFSVGQLLYLDCIHKDAVKHVSELL